MSLSLDALRLLVEYGLTAEQILAVAEAQGEAEPLAAFDPVTERKRAADRDRMREKRQVARLSRDTSRDIAPSLPPSPQTPQPPTHPRVEEPPIVPQSDEKPVRAIRLSQADVEGVWSITPSSARTRTSRADVKAALQAAARRGRAPSEIIAGLKAYYASPAATKDNGQFAKGAHRMIEKDRYLDFVPSAEPVAVPVSPWPSRLREFARNGYWNAVDWGPRPDKPNCRVPTELIAEHLSSLAKERAA